MRLSRRVAGRAIALAATATIALLTLLPGQGRPDVSHLCLVCGSLGGVDAFLNILLFAPLGIGLALAGVRAGPAIAAMCAYTLGIEVLQIVAIPGRYGTFADVVTNSTGGLLGYFAGLHGERFVLPKHDMASRLTVGWLVCWLLLQVVVAYSFVPVATDAPYFAVFRRPHWSSGLRFPGTVVSSRLGAEQITDGPVPNGERLQAAYQRGDELPFEATVVPAGPIPDRREIVMISGAGGGIASFEQEGPHLIFGWRTGADAMRLRPLWFRLHNVFNAAQPETLRFEARYDRSAVVLTAKGAGPVVEQRFTHRLSGGWMFLVPFHKYTDATPREFFANLVFMTALMIPAGYWLLWARRGARSGDSARSSAGTLLSAATAASLVVGLVLVPRAFGLGPATALEWLLCGLGALIGWTLAAAVRLLSSSST